MARSAATSITNAPEGHSRRSIVAGLAAMLPAAAIASTSLSSPAKAMPISEPDPIFAAIRDCRAADEIVEAALKEYGRREEILQRETGEMDPAISMMVPVGPVLGEPDLQYSERCSAYSHHQIDEFCPHNLYPELNEIKHKSFAESVRFHDEIMGDSERVLDEAHDAAADALDTMIETVPTTMAGVLALLKSQREILESDSERLFGGRSAGIAASLEEALLALQAAA